MLWRHLLKALIAALIPVLYSVLISNFPDFPLNIDNLLALVLWLVGSFVGGWQVSLYRTKKRLYKP